MTNTNEPIRFPCLALFAEGAAEGGSGAGGQTGVKSGSAAGSDAGTASDQGVNVPSASSGSGESGDAGRDAADRHSQDAASPDTTTDGEEASSDPDTEFDRMIRGRFKDAFDRRVQSIVQKRVARLKESAEKYELLRPYLERLPAEGRDAALSGDENGMSDPARAEAVRFSSARSEAEREAMDREAAERAEAERTAGRERIVSHWLSEAEALRERFPSFDLKSELNNASFRALIGNGIPLETAFLVAEKDALIPAALHAAAKDAEARTAAALSSGFGRPREGATAGGTAQVIKSDVTRFTKADRDEIVRRTAAGERIVF